MAANTPARAPAQQTALEQALLAVELELMRAPSLARLNGARRREISRGILRSLNTRGFLTGIPALDEEPQLRAA